MIIGRLRWTKNLESFSCRAILMNLDKDDINRIIEMAWEDRTPFEAIHFQFSKTEAEVIALMRMHLKRSSFNLWRKRVNTGISQKHRAKRGHEVNRFKCTLQRTITINKISKRS